MTLVRPAEYACRASMDDGHAVVSISGELDLSTAPELSRSLADVLDQRPTELTLDMAAVGFIDCTTVSLLVRASKRLQEQGGVLVLSCPSRPVRRVLELVGLEGLLAGGDSKQPGLHLRGHDLSDQLWTVIGHPVDQRPDRMRGQLAVER